MDKIINEHTMVEYKVVYEGNVLLEHVSKMVAENYIAGLPKQVKESVKLIPITNDGLQVLLG